jgi:hypothetical protein
MEPSSKYSDPTPSENTLISQMESLSPKEKVGLTVAVSVNVMAFSKAPFNEPWYDISNGDLRELQDINEMSRIVSSILEDPSLLKIQSDEEGNEIWEKQSPDPLSGYKVKTEYPLSKILKTYIREIRDPESVLLVKYTNSDNKERIVDLSKATIDDFPIEPVAVFRIRNIKNNVIDEVIGEVVDYLNEEQKVDLESTLLEEHTAYLGEVANLKNEGLFLLSALKASISSFNPFPKQIVYLTKPGTSIEDSDRDINPISRIIKGVYKSLSLVEEKKAYENEFGDKSVLYIYKINPTSSE